MKTSLFLILLGLCSVLDADSSLPLSEYPELTKRNIFDATRQPVRVQPPRVETPKAAPPKKDSLKLTGNLLRPGKSVAFFAGSSPEMSGVLTDGESLGEFRIAEILPAEVVLVNQDGETFRLAVGEGLLRIGDADWQKSSGEIYSSIPPSAPASATTGKEAPKEDVNDVMRRLMERRKKELNS